MLEEQQEQRQSARNTEVSGVKQAKEKEHATGATKIKLLLRTVNRGVCPRAFGSARDNTQGMKRGENRMSKAETWWGICGESSLVEQEDHGLCGGCQDVTEWENLNQISGVTERGKDMSRVAEGKS